MKLRDAALLLTGGMLLFGALAIVPAVLMRLAPVFGPPGQLSIGDPPESYRMLFEAHVAPSIVGLLWPGVLGVTGLWIAARRQAERSTAGSLAFAGVALWLVGGLAMLATLPGIDVETLASAVGILRLIFAVLLVADAMVMLGIVLAVAGPSAREDDDALVYILRWSCTMRVLADLLLLLGQLWVTEPQLGLARSHVVVHLVVLLLVVASRGGPRTSGQWLVLKVAVLGTGAALVLREANSVFGPALAVVLGEHGLLSSLLDAVAGSSVLLAVLWPWRDAGTPTAQRGYLMLLRAGFSLWCLLGAILVLLPPDPYVFETYFVLGVEHLRLLLGTVVAGALALRLLAAEDYAHATTLERTLPAAAVTVGLLWMLTVMLALGQEGMPRRYATYTPQFQELQVQASLAIFLLVAGVVLEPLVWLRARARRLRVGEPGRPQ